MTALDMMGVALAALLSENFIFVNCMGIGTRRSSFSDPIDALRTGYCLTAVMVLGACAPGWRIFWCSPGLDSSTTGCCSWPC